MGTLARGSQLALQTIRLFVCGLRESERLPHGKLPCCVFFWFCWMAPELGRCFLLDVSYGYITVVCIVVKQCRFLFIWVSRGRFDLLPFM